MKKNWTQNQHKAIYSQGNILVLAGAGSGKTAVFVQRYIQLLLSNPSWSPKNIVALSFTRLSAKELKERIQKELSTNEDEQTKKWLEELEEAPITTIHGFAQQLLRNHPLEAEIDPLFEIIEEETANFLKEESITQTLRYFSRKNSLSLKKLLRIYTIREIRKILKEILNKKELFKKIKIEDSKKELEEIGNKCLSYYEKSKYKKGAIDYDDIIEKTITLLNNDACRKELQHYYKALMIDEFQDSDNTQWTLLKQLCKEENYTKDPKLFLVGDIKQSIYQFRGAEPDLFIKIKDEFSLQKNTCSVISLQENFRTQPKLIEKINTLFTPIMNSISCPYEPLIATRAQENGQYEELTFQEKPTEEEECQAIALYIENLLKKGLISPSEIAILSRTKTQFENIQKELLKLNIESKIESAGQVYKRQENIDYLVLIKALIISDTLSWITVLTGPLYNLDTEKLMITYLKHKKSNILEILDTLKEDVFKEAKKEVEGLLKRSLNESILDIVTDNLIKKQKTFFETQKSVLTQLIALEKSCKGNRYQFLTEIQYKFDNNERLKEEFEGKNKVSIMSIHASKGLEFKMVILMNTNKSFRPIKADPILIEKENILLKHEENTKEEWLQTLRENAIEEEKRLLYVALTRARDHLIVSRCIEEKSEIITSFEGFL